MLGWKIRFMKPREKTLITGKSGSGTVPHIHRGNEDLAEWYCSILVWLSTFGKGTQSTGLKVIHESCCTPCISCVVKLLTINNFAKHLLTVQIDSSWWDVDDSPQHKWPTVSVTYRSRAIWTGTFQVDPHEYSTHHLRKALEKAANIWLSR